MLKIRLTRFGKKHQPSYRIVVTPKENPVQGQYLALLGTYNPLKGDVQIDTAKATEWLNKGAQPSERLARILTKAGVSHKSVVVKTYTPKPKEDKPKAAENEKASEVEMAAEEVTEVKDESAASEEKAPEAEAKAE